MKRCPECRRDYYDETLLFCLDDGTRLLEGPAVGGEQTAILSAFGVAPSGEVREDRTLVFSAQPAEGGTQNNSIAVLPFANISADEENEYFCDGLAEELLNALSKIDELKVAARTSAFSFKGKNANVSEIGRKARCPKCSRRQCQEIGESSADLGAARERGGRISSLVWSVRPRVQRHLRSAG
jgi:hypothetical protein